MAKVPAIRVGVTYGTPEPAEHGAYWVEIDDVRLDKGIVDVTYEAHVQFNHVTVRFVCSSFASVDKDS